MRKRLLIGLIVAAIVPASAFAISKTLGSHASQQGRVAIESTSPVQEMSVFSTPPEVLPAEILARFQSLTAGAPPGAVDLPGALQLDQGQVLLAGLGPDRRTFYAVPTLNGEVCWLLTEEAAGCLPGFAEGSPISTDGTGAYPPESGPPGVVYGLAKDEVTDLQVMVDGSPQPATLANNAWYYELPDNHTALTALPYVIVTLRDGSTENIPLNNEDPRTLGPNPGPEDLGAHVTHAAGSR